MASRLKHRKAAHNRLQALSHPLRAAIFQVLADHTASISEITRELELDRKEIPNVSHHVKQLVKLDCAEEVGEKRVGRQLTTLYKATERAMIETAEWEALVEENPVMAEHLIGGFMQAQLDDYTAAVKAGTLGPTADFHITRTPRILDAEGFTRAMELLEQCRLAMDEVEREAAERRSADGSDAVHASVCLSLFVTPPTRT